MRDKNKRIVLLLTLFTIIFTMLGGSFAYFRWSSSQEDNTEVTFTITENFSCSGATGGVISSSEIMLAPAECTNTDRTIRREVSLFTTSKFETTDIFYDLWLDVVDIGEGLSKSDNLMYVLSETDSCTGEAVASGNFKNVTNKQKVNLFNDMIFTGTTSKKYYLFIWLDAAEESSSTMNQSFEFTFGGECDNNPATGKFLIEEVTSSYQLIRASVVNPVNNINAYQVTKTEEEPTEWVTLSESEAGSSYNLNYIAEEVGTYYVWFKDTEDNVIKKSVTVDAINTSKPVCTWGEFTPGVVSNGETSSITLTCTSDNLADITLNTSDITLSNNNVTLDSVSREQVNNGYKYTFTVRGTSGNGNTNLTLPANKVSTIHATYNDSVTSSNIVVINVFFITYKDVGNTNFSGTHGANYPTEYQYGTGVSLDTPTKTGYSFGGYYLNSSGTGDVISEISNIQSGDITLYAKWVDNSVPVGSISTTSTLQATKQTATLSCQDTVGVTSYYFGTNQSPVASDYTSVTSTTNLSLTKDITTSGTYYLYCKDSTGNVSSRVSKTYYTYKVNNMLQNVTGSTYTTTDYTKVTNYTYLAPSGTSLTIASIYTIPTGSSAARLYYYSVGEPSTTALSTIAKATAPILSANSVYTMWFTRNNIYIKYKPNNGTVTPSTTQTSNGTTNNYTWSIDSNGYITRSTNGAAATSNLSAYRYGVTSIDLPNYNNSAYLNITRDGYNAVSGAQWICESGCTTANKTFSHSAITLSSSNDMCNASSKDCTIVLKVNWVDNVAPTGSISTSISSSTVTAKLTASDSGSGVKSSYGWSMNTSSTCNSSVSFTTSTNSTYTFTLNSSGTKYVCARVEDNAGNVRYISSAAVGSYNNYTTASGYSTFTAPASGYYQLEVWGAQGGSSLNNNVIYATNVGYGGYSTGVVALTKGEKLYVYVGGKGTNGTKSTNVSGGYNGGGSGTYDGSDDESAGGGGGATHIAKVTGLLSTLSSTVNREKVLIVAGGGGGSSWTYAAGAGGGIYGTTTSGTSTSYPTQTSGYAFGKGQNASGTGDNDGVGGGGGGWYGGYSNNVAGKSSGTGGSGYIGSSSLISYGGVTKSMYCYNCTTSTAAETLTYTTTSVSDTATSKYAKSGDGAAKITFVGNVSSETVKISVASSFKIKVNAFINNSVSSYCVNQSSEGTSGCEWISQTSNTFTTSSSYIEDETYYVHIKDSNGDIYHSNPVVMYYIFNEASFTFIPDDTSVTTPYEYVQEDENNWKIRFLTTGTVTFDKDTDIEVFLVGGGGGAGRGASSWSMGNGGGGGYNTLADFSPVAGEDYKITIGAGGAACTSAPGVGSNGGTSSAFGFEAAGGYGGGYEGNGVCQSGGNGGSGGGGRGGAGGSNGSDGTGDCAGSGDGVNSYEFRETSSGILYAGGGAGRGGTAGSGGGGAVNTAGGANTGGGGGGTNAYAGVGGAGGSGIVVIRNSRKAIRSLYAGSTLLGKASGKTKATVESDENWNVQFLVGGVFIPNQNMTVDIFMVGGGGGGANGTNGESTNSGAGGGGGGGGYRTTRNSYTLTANQTYEIVVGVGGQIGQPGEPSIIKLDGTDLLTANGGAAGGVGTANSTTGGGIGGAGGSTGGNGGIYTYITASKTYDATAGGNGAYAFADTTYGIYGGAGGGGGGGAHPYYYDSSGTIQYRDWGKTAGGAGGSGGGGYGSNYSSYTYAASGKNYTGGGGGGGSGRYTTAGLGGSGIVIIRNAR